MDANERTAWIEKVSKYVRLVADNVDRVEITTADGDTVVFQKGEK